MIDKQIIINRVDVSRCKHIIDYDPPESQKVWGNAIHKGACRIYSGDCKDNPNCYYKQLKRKEKECNELKYQLRTERKDKKYIKNCCIEAGEELEKCEIMISTGDIVKRVSFQMDDITLKHPVLITTPVENFEVLENE